MTLDPDALDIESLACGPLSRKYIKLAKHLRAIEKRAHEKVKVCRSELISTVNRNPEATTGKSKPNAADIEAYFRQDKTYQELKETWISAEYEADYADSAQQAVTYGRRKDLEFLIRLFERNYFAGPAVVRNLSEEMQQAEKNVNIAKTLQRTK